MVGTAVVTAGVGVAKAISGGMKAKKAKEAAKKAQAELEKQKRAFENLDTSNPYQNMENVMEDLTVNQQEAEFVKQQQEQQRANILDKMRGAAGGSGIAALAQTLANQGSLDAQKAATSIGKQEQANQMAERQETSRLQGLEREGELISRQAQAGKISSLMGMAADELSNQRTLQAQGQQQMWSGISQTAGAATDFIGGGGVGKLKGAFQKRS